MNRKWFLVILASIMILTLAACTGAAEPQTPPATATDTDTDQDHDDDSDASTGSDTDTEEIVINASEIFSQRCSGCHGGDRTGNQGPPLLPANLTKDPSVYVNTITNGSGPMPTWGSRLSADEINALVEFILSDVE